MFLTCLHAATGSFDVSLVIWLLALRFLLLHDVCLPASSKEEGPYRSWIHLGHQRTAQRLVAVREMRLRVPRSAYCSLSTSTISVLDLSDSCRVVFCVVQNCLRPDPRNSRVVWCPLRRIPRR